MHSNKKIVCPNKNTLHSNKRYYNFPICFSLINNFFGSKQITIYLYLFNEIKNNVHYLNQIFYLDVHYVAYLRIYFQKFMSTSQQLHQYLFKVKKYNEFIGFITGIIHGEKLS